MNNTNHSEPIIRVTPPSQKNGKTTDHLSALSPTGDAPPMTDRRLFAKKMNGTSPQDIQHIRAVLAPEYKTLASYKEKLLSNPDFKHHFFLINGEKLEIYSSIDSALEQGYTQYGNDLFFVGPIDEKQINAYLST